MGQQQLLLLVLSTVIVGLATVAGIQAFSENQAQAEQDALVQRAINIGNDVLAAHNEPTQFGGINLDDGPSTSEVATAAGYDSDAGIPADGAGDNAKCKIHSVSSGTATIGCTSDGTYTFTDGQNQLVEVTVDPDASSKVSVAGINSNASNMSGS